MLVISTPSTTLKLHQLWQKCFIKIVPGPQLDDTQQVYSQRAANKSWNCKSQISVTTFEISQKMFDSVWPDLKFNVLFCMTTCESIIQIDHLFNLMFFSVWPDAIFHQICSIQCDHLWNLIFYFSNNHQKCSSQVKLINTLQSLNTTQESL